MAVKLEQGDGVEKDLSAALKWYLRAANQGHAAAQNNLGNLYHEGQGVEKDMAQVFKWWGLAAIQGQADAIKGLRSLPGQVNNTKLNEGRDLINQFVPISE